MTTPLTPEDYAEPRLPGEERFGAAPAVIPVPQQRIIEKLDEYMSRRDYDGAEKHLLYWLAEAEQGRDRRGKLMLCSELTGHYRKTGDREKALRYAEQALALLAELGYDGSVTGGTARVNAATAYSAFGENEHALALFERARADFEADPRTDPSLLGGLFNNMALACRALGRYEEAFSLFDKALAQMGRVPGGCLEQAITCLNMADATAGQLGPEAGKARSDALLDRAWKLLREGGAPHDGYYAFVLEKCAPGFADHGRPAQAALLQKLAEDHYAGA